MTLAEVFALLALIVSLLMLLAQVVHVTFDIAWRISHDNGNNDKKNDRPQLPTVAVILFDCMPVRS